MKEPIISDLKNVTEERIKNLRFWLGVVKINPWKADTECPFTNILPCEENEGCNMLFDNLTHNFKYCPCHIYGQESTIIAFEIICDMWESENKSN